MMRGMPLLERFSGKTLDFLQKAGRQKRIDWLERNRAEYEDVLLAPLRSLAVHLKKELGPIAPGYNFPQRGIGRIKRAADRAREDGRPLKNWVHYSAARPRESRFTHNPNLYFMIHPGETRHQILTAGGLYMPSSPQTRALREAISSDASAFDKLFSSKDFKRSYPDGFSDEKISSRPTRGYDRDHARMDWLRLQAFFVWRPYTKREFISSGFADIVTRDLRQALRLNALLDLAVAGRLPSKESKNRAPSMTERLDKLAPVRNQMDF